MERSTVVVLATLGFFLTAGIGYLVFGPDAEEETAAAHADASHSADASHGGEAKTSSIGVKPPTMPKVDLTAPEDVAAAPADAIKTESGLATKVLAAGTGTDHPKRWDKVQVHYTGWTTDGKSFDSSLKKGRPLTIGVGEVISGWTEGLQLMVRGEKRRMWIPQDLAYKGQPGAPAGMLVFDVELLDIIPGEEPPPPPPLSPTEGAIALESGASYVELKPGTGTVKPDPWDAIEAHFMAWDADGNIWLKTPKGRPGVVPLDRVFPGWRDAATAMVPGQKIRAWYPESTAGAVDERAPKGDLTMELELVSIQERKPPIPAPSDVAEPPADATTTGTGLVYKVLTPGTGTEKPTAASKVRVHYTGWTTDGQMFDSSVQRGEPAQFGLNGVIAGWTEGLQLMVAGEKTRFWIPVDLAYKGRPGKPAGTLVFDVELLEIVK